ncbi:MAG: hypothetical protein PWP03_317 [Candidatus Woesearchaeota archaeon]|nr:hypothetical protein [Candidatus Woesearchaeota archaeon]
MKRLIYLISLIVVMLFITSCTSNTSTTNFSSPYVGGDNGLIAEFQENSPPDEIYDNGLKPFNIVLRLKNDGEFKIARNSILIKATGFSPKDFGTTESALTITSLDTDLDPKQKSSDGTIKQGGETIVSLPKSGSLAYKNSISGTGELKLPMSVDLCYLYKTRSTSLLCVTPDLLRASSDDVCEVNGEKQVFSSGSPLKVTKLSESATKDKLRIEFEITFNGKGRLIKPNGKSFNSLNCGASEYDFDTVDTVYVVVDPDHQWGSMIRCKGLSSSSYNSGYVRLFDSNGAKKTVINCEIPISSINKGNYVKPIDIDIYYQYKERLNKEITIKHIETG